MWNDVRTSASLMKRAAFLVIVFLAACSREPQRVAAKPSTQTTANAQMQTIDSTDSRPAVMQPPPVLPDEAPAPKPLNLAPNQEVPVLTPQDEHVRAQLPFAPAIALDPIDGLKVSIRATTPVVEYKNHLFYFSSDANKRTFVAAPDQYLKGPFAHL
jgi:YHS domain-containing protein